MSLVGENDEMCRVGVHLLLMEMIECVVLKKVV